LGSQACSGKSASFRLAPTVRKAKAASTVRLPDMGGTRSAKSTMLSVPVTM
jgi:hypothetical protein